MERRKLSGAPKKRMEVNGAPRRQLPFTTFKKHQPPLGKERKKWRLEMKVVEMKLVPAAKAPEPFIIEAAGHNLHLLHSSSTDP